MLHLAANSGFVKGVQHIMSLRPDAVHDTDRKVLIVGSHPVVMIIIGAYPITLCCSQ